jgi:flagellar motor switch protein FliN/FliY
LTETSDFSSPVGSLSPAAQARAAAAAGEAEFAARLAALPAYSRSLLRIQVPVVVKLAETRLSVGRILELGPGSIMHFDKPCDQPLTLCVGTREVAVGETVKVGEKFGLRITSMVMPQEKFGSVKAKAAEERS